MQVYNALAKVPLRSRQPGASAVVVSINRHWRFIHPFTGEVQQLGGRPAFARQKARVLNSGRATLRFQQDFCRQCKLGKVDIWCKPIGDEPFDTPAPAGVFAHYVNFRGHILHFHTSQLVARKWKNGID